MLPGTFRCGLFRGVLQYVPFYRVKGRLLHGEMCLFAS